MLIIFAIICCNSYHNNPQQLRKCSNNVSLKYFNDIPTKQTIRIKIRERL